MAVCFVDTETTGLDPDRHEIWEVGLIDPLGDEHQWFLPVDESRADLIALNIGGYFDRYPEYLTGSTEGLTHPLEFARHFQRITRGMHLAGAVVSFDADRLHSLLIDHEVIPAWHYHLIDVEALAAGRLGVAPPWNSTALSLAVGVDPAQFDRHTALGDARWAKAIYREIVDEPTGLGRHDYAEALASLGKS